MTSMINVPMFARSLAVALSLFAVGCFCSCTCSKVKQESFALGNGLKVELAAAPRGDDAAVVLIFDVGQDHDPAGRSGMTRLIALLLATPEWGIYAGSDFTELYWTGPASKAHAQLDA